MAKYKLFTGLWETPLEEFNSDKEAWNGLRKMLPNKYACLYKIISIKVPINNEAEYVEKYNAKYGPKPIGYGPKGAKLMHVGEKYMESTVKIPILEGITSDEYNPSAKVPILENLD